MRNGVDETKGHCAPGASGPWTVAFVAVVLAVNPIGLEAADVPLIPCVARGGLVAAEQARERLSPAGQPLAPPVGGAEATSFAPEYYQIELVTTRRIPGTGWAAGTAEVTFSPSPFGVAIALDGSYRYDLAIQVDRLPSPPEGEYAVWVTTTDLSEAQRVGTLDDTGRATGAVRWNKFLVVISLEAEGSDHARWQGPIALRGLSRSGLMHTMAGHGPFQQENCAAYGY
jgi:hypothetical protein